MKNTIFMTVEEVAEVLGTSKSYAYKLIQRLNADQKAKGALTMHGKLNRKYLFDKIYKGEEMEGL